jgi:serine/threonine protein kinase
MKLIKHPNVIKIFEVRKFFFFEKRKSLSKFLWMRLTLLCYLWICLQVMASKTKIYIVIEFVDGGELFDKIVRN